MISKAEITNYLYDRQNVILETDPKNNVKARYIKGINYIAKADAANKEAYYLFNGHGDVVQTVDEAGTVQNQYDYDIWGNPTLTIETSENAIRYSGEFMDSETGLYYLRARYYDPNIGRFVSEDSYWGEDENPLSLNLYTYCANDPIKYTDPTGHNYYVDKNGKGHVSEITVGWNCGLNPDIIYDKVIFEGDHINVTFGGAQIGSVSGNKDIVDSYNKSKASATFMYIPSTMKLDTVVTGESTAITNRGYIETLNTSKNSSLFLDSYGITKNVNIAEGATAQIHNYNQNKDPIKKQYEVGIANITGQINSRINLSNNGGIGEVHTGDYSRNEVINENDKAYVNWLETGLDNTTTTNVKNTTGEGKTESIEDKVKSNLYQLGYHNVYSNYTEARNQFLNEYLDGGHSLAVDFKRMGVGEFYSILLTWTNRAMDPDEKKLIKWTGKTTGATIGPDNGMGLPIDLYNPAIDSIYDNYTKDKLMRLTMLWYNSETKKEEEKVLNKLSEFRDFLDSKSGKVLTGAGKIMDGIDEFINDATMALMVSGFHFPVEWSELTLEQRIVAETREIGMLESRLIKVNLQLFAEKSEISLKNIYSSIKLAPKYPNGFSEIKNGTVKVKVKNADVLDELRNVESGLWKKVYKDGYDASGKKVSVHYFQSESGKVFDVKVKSGWSNK